MRIIPFLFFQACVLSTAFAQTEGDPPLPPAVSDSIIYDPLTIEEYPVFPGGTDAMMKYLASNIKYPGFCKEMGISGKVFIEFIVEKDGSVSNVYVRKGVAACPAMDKEAVRAIKTFPKWKPGMQNGKPVRTKMIIPVSFKLMGIEQGTLSSYPGGSDSLQLFIKKNLQYPKKAQKNNIEGGVAIKLVVDKTGKVKDVQYMHNPNPELAKEAVRIGKLIKKINPAKDPKGNPIDSDFVFVVKFELGDK